jgi:hypothetical protein
MVLAKISSTILNKNFERGHPCLASYFKRNDFTLSSFGMMLAVSYIIFIMLMCDPFMLSLFGILIRGFQILSKLFSASTVFIM